MNQINLLREALKPHLGWHGARLNFLALFLIALLRVKTINLAELATGFRSEAKIGSSYKRLQRFFRKFDFDCSSFAKLIVALMNIPQPWVLSIDRTEWSLCWAIKTGDWLHQHQPLKIKKHGRRQASIFRYGLDYLRSIFTDLDLKFDDFLHSLQFLSCT
jgi:hypothetical protein